MDQTKWPWSIAALFLGATTADAVFSAAQTAPDAATKSDQVCEANFYVGVYQAANGASDQARQLWQSAVNSCPHIDLEYMFAGFELARLH